MDIQCDKCQGTGLLELTGVYADTLHELARHDEMTATKLSKLMDCSPQSMWNRLDWLRSHGFAESRNYGRETYFRVSAAALADDIPPCHAKHHGISE